MSVRIASRKEDYDIRRGEIYYIDRSQRDAETGVEQWSGRPAIIVSNNANNAHSDLVEVVYLTTKPKKSLPTHADIHSAKLQSTALCEQITTVDKSRVGDYVGVLSQRELEALDAALLVSIGIQTEDRAEKLDGDNESEIMHGMEQETISVIKAERDLYRNLYEKLLDKLI